MVARIGSNIPVLLHAAFAKVFAGAWQTLMNRENCFVVSKLFSQHIFESEFCVSRKKVIVWETLIQMSMTREMFCRQLSLTRDVIRASILKSPVRLY